LPALNVDPEVWTGTAVRRDRWGRKTERSEGLVPNARQLEPNRRLAQADRQLASGGLRSCRSVSEAVQ
jgi:hypothetical protein